jgi:hypothetical protein
MVVFDVLHPAPLMVAVNAAEVSFHWVVEVSVGNVAVVSGTHP